MCMAVQEPSSECSGVGQTRSFGLIEKTLFWLKIASKFFQKLSVSIRMPVLSVSKGVTGISSQKIDQFMASRASV